MCESGHSGHWWVVGGGSGTAGPDERTHNLVTTKRPHRRRCPNGKWKGERERE